MNLRLSSMLATLLLGTVLNAGTIEIVTKFSKTGGLYGDAGMNTVGNKVNGRDICSSANNNNNDYPGCDMSQDPEYNNNDTDDNVTDDYYTGDLIVRTSDLFEVKAGWNATGVTEPVTLTSTLPSFGGKNYLKWESLPSSCKDGSSISDDGLKLTCVRTNDASISYSEDSPFHVKVKASTPNNTKTGEISFSISSDGLETKTDGTEAELTITAKPMWNIQNKHVETFSGQTNKNGDEGYIIRYAYILEADEVIDENETSSAVLGNEALADGLTLSFTDDVSKISPNAELIGCSISGAEGGYEPYPWYHEDAPEKSVGSLESALSVSCDQSAIGDDVTIEYTGIDTSLKHVPTLYANGGIIPKTRMPVASGTIDIFVPIDDIKNATDIGNDSTQLDTNNTLTSFDPDSISGQSNFNSLAESTNDNSVPVPLIYHGPGYTSGGYHKYFSNSVDSLTPLPDVTNGFYSADGVLTPDKTFASWAYISNGGNKDFNSTILCDVIDKNLYDVVDITDDSAVKLYGNAEDLNAIIEYATGYVGTWPPALDEDNSAKVIDECSNDSVTWYSTTSEARDNGKISKVRLKFPDEKGLPAGNTAGFIINLKARSEDLSDTTIPSGTNFVNYSAVHDTVWINSTDNWTGANRVLNSYPTPASGGDYRADRAVLVRAKVRTTKELSTTIVEPSDEVTVHIESTFTTDSLDPESSTVKVTEMLAPGLNYVVGSGSIGDPTMGSCDDIEDLDPLKSVCTADHQVLVWDLGTRTANDAVEDIEYNFVVSAFAPSGESSTYTIISSPTDTSHPNVRKANRNISISIPASLFISKEVNTPFREIDETPIEFTSYARNGSSETLQNIDIIDILPFNGDGAKGFKFTVASTKVKKKRDLPTSFNGTLEFSKAIGEHACNSGVTWYFTDRDPTKMDIAPTATSNKSGGKTTWCEGTDTGPADGCGYDNSAVTAVRLKGGDLNADATCAFKIQLTPKDNKKGDVYTNTASSYADGVSLPTLSNDVSAFVPTTLLGDYVWLDYDADGIQDKNEIGADGISMELLDSTDTKITDTLTDENGRYIFEELDADTEYKVKATLPEYYRFTRQGLGTNRKKDSDIIVDDYATDITGMTVTKSLNYNQQYRHFDVGIISTLTITGKAYKQEDNSSMDGMRVKLYRDENSDGILDDNDTLIDSQDTLDIGDDLPNYKFTNIFNGDYLIIISGREEGYVLKSDDTLDLSVNGVSAVDQDFVYNEIPESQDINNSAIVNTADALDIKDLNSTDDGDIHRFVIKDLSPELTRSGTLFYLDDDNNRVIVNSETELTLGQANGLKFDPNTGFMGNVWFNYLSIDDDNEESDPATVWLTIMGESTISNLAWYDENRDGIQDDSESGVAGVQLRLLNRDGTVVNNPVGRFQTPYIVTTDTNGHYIFENLSDGNYTVEVYNKNGYALSDKKQSGDDSTDSDFDSSTFKTENIELGIDEDNLDIDVGLFVPTVSGHLYHDGNGNGAVDGNLTDSADGHQLYVTLVQSGKKVATKALNSDGNYTFGVEDGLRAYADYSLVLSDEANRTTLQLPTDWYPENNSGILVANVLREDLVNIDFSINKKPVANNVNEDMQFNPGGDKNVTISGFDISDVEDTTPTTIVITKIPTNAKLYYQGALVVNNVELGDVNQSAFVVDPNDGDLNVTFNYKTIDRAGISSNEATVTMPFDGLKISGAVYADGNNNQKVDGTKIDDSMELWVRLIDKDSGDVLASKAIDANGEYMFDNSDGILNDKNYTIILTTENNITASLPEGWNNADGEQIGFADNGLDGDADGQIAVDVSTLDIPNINFGINERPLAKDKDIAPSLNPGGEERVILPKLPISDNEDTEPTTIKIVTLPETTDGVLYYDGIAVTAGQVINEYNSTLLSVDPKAGEPTVEFTYLTIDKSGVASNIATIKYEFSGISVSGNLYSDGNNDGIINGTKIEKVNGDPVYVTLLSSTDEVITSTKIDNTGAYSFSAGDGYIEPNKSYTLVISTVADQTTSTLPSDWNHFDGEGVGSVDSRGSITPANSDGTRDGIVTVDVVEVSVPEVNFGINQQAVANDNNATAQLNPGQSTTVVVPTLDISDSEDETPTTITIKTLPTNGTLYYDGVVITSELNITSFDNSKLKVDPIDGEQVIVFTYTSTDSTGFESEEARVTMPFRGLRISGNIFDDGNADGDVNGTRVSKAGDTPLFVNLLDSNGTLITSYQLESDPITDNNESNISSIVGLYSFDGNDSVTANTNYRIILATEANATTPLLPVDWNNSDGEYSPSECVIEPIIRAKTTRVFSKTCGVDNVADGAIDIHLKRVDVPNINLGINERPTTENVASAVTLNPNAKVQVVDLVPEDREDGIPYIVTINTLPTAGTLYYDDIEVVEDQNISDFNNSKLMVKPNGGNTAVVFTYSATDRTGWTSIEPSRVRMPFYVPAPRSYGGGGGGGSSDDDATPAQDLPVDDGVEEEVTEEEEDDTPAVIFNLDIADDAVEANTEGAVTTIDVLGNDEVGEDATIELLNLEDGEILWDDGTAVGGTNIETTDELYVPGEGTWRVVDNHVTFTAEDGFTGTPTPIYYLVKDANGNQSNVAELSISSSCSCDTYESKKSDSVSALGNIGMFILLLIQMLSVLFFFKKEEELAS